jgi:hypothetical protein
VNITDTLRIRRHDDKNIVVEILTETENKRTGEVNRSWKREGFYPTIKIALEAILRKDMLIDLDEIETVTALVSIVASQINTLLDVLGDEKELLSDIDLKFENEQLRKENEKLKERTK